jgi:hypothetical protein
LGNINRTCQNINGPRFAQGSRSLYRSLDRARNAFQNPTHCRGSVDALWPKHVSFHVKRLFGDF